VNVLITGAGGGLGRELCERFLQLQCRVHICDIDEAALRTLATAHPNLRYSVADVANTRQVETMIEQAYEWMGSINVLVNNVGIAGPSAPIEAIPDEDWLAVLQANLLGAVRCIRGVLPRMKQQGSGSIINVSTTSVITRPLNRATYVVSKAALESLTICIAREAGPFGIRCNTVRPGMMRNDRLLKVMARVAEQTHRSTGEVIAEQLKFVSMRTMVEMRDVANAIIFLASSEAHHVSGQVFAVDGDFGWEI
jgi:NAD(P)-dependent dehydrogenase (short-subunit alcohol dehydrogenase family)